MGYNVTYGGVKMALIKCPECGNEVSSVADACPKCGYPIKKYVNFMFKEKISDDAYEYPHPISDDWTKFFHKKRNRNIILSVVMWIISGCLPILFVLLDIPALNVISFILVIISSCWFGIAITAKIRIRKEDGYTVLVYNCGKAYLYIENQLVDSSLTNRTLYGELPNKKRIIVTISLWDGSIKIGIDAKGNDTQLL